MAAIRPPSVVIRRFVVGFNNKQRLSAVLSGRQPGLPTGRRRDGGPTPGFRTGGVGFAAVCTVNVTQAGGQGRGRVNFTSLATVYMPHPRKRPPWGHFHVVHHAPDDALFAPGNARSLVAISQPRKRARNTKREVRSTARCDYPDDLAAAQPPSVAPQFSGFSLRFSWTPAVALHLPWGRCDCGGVP
jgi:hypothetical protein